MRWSRFLASKPTSFFGKVTRFFAIFAISLLLALYAAYLSGARINRTHSLPKGVYWIVDKEPERDDIVSFWPDGSEAFQEAKRRGYIIPGMYNDRGDGGYGALLKKLAAVPGDIISITDATVIVNNCILVNSRPLNCDNTGSPLPRLRLNKYQLKENEVLFMSEYLPRSFDGRYFGIQDKRQIIDVLVPVFVW